MHTWLLLTYNVPRNPTANRVYVWRKLKRLGALLLNDALWVLPASAQTSEQLQWLGTEIEELGGEYSLWESRFILDGKEQALINQFAAQVEGPYKEILTELKRTGADLTVLSRRYQQVRAQDYFQCELGRRVLKALMTVKKGVTR